MSWLSQLFQRRAAALGLVDLPRVPGAGEADPGDAPPPVADGDEAIWLDEWVAVPSSEVAHVMHHHGRAYHHTHEKSGCWAYSPVR